MPEANLGAAAAACQIPCTCASALCAVDEAYQQATRAWGTWAQKVARSTGMHLQGCG